MAEILAKSINCASCGAPMEVNSAFTKTVICGYCGTTNALDDRGIDPTGKMAKLSQARSIFSIGRRGAMEKQKFQVLGRLRYGYDEGFWDEWFLQFDDGHCEWVTEEEGELSSFRKQLLTKPIENLDRIRVGQTVAIENHRVFITEICDATILGGEGELHYRVVPGKELLHIEGNSGGALVSVEVWPREIEVHTGKPVLYKDIVMEKESDPYA